MDTASFSWSVGTLKNGQNLVIPNVFAMPAEAAAEKQIFQLQDIFSLLNVPIFSVAGKFIGFMGFDDTQKNRTWFDEDIQILRVVSEIISQYLSRRQAELALKQLNLKLEEQVQERTTQLQRALELESTLKRITDKVRDNLNEEQILQTAVQELALVLNTISCTATLYALRQNTAGACYEYVVSSIPAAENPVPQSKDFPVIHNQLLQGQCFQFCFLHSNLSQDRVVAMVCSIVDNVDNQGVLGDLWLLNQPDYTFDDLEVRLVKQVANQCAIAVRQARLYRAAQVQVDELKRLHRLKDDFLSTVSHELRSPMANINMATQMLEIVLKREGLFDTTNPNRVTQYFQILDEECQRELKLINDLLDLSRLEAGAELLILTHVDLRDLIPRIVEPFLELACRQKQSLQIHIPTELPSLMTDASILERILTELLNNACKYTPEGEKITVSAHATEFATQLQISNSGVEITASELPRIFEKFYRIPNNDPWRHGGTGLGLALVKKLVDCLGAEIQVESSNRQTTFILKIEPAASTQDKAKLQSKAQEGSIP